MEIDPGLCAAVTLTVSDDDTAIALCSGSVPVLATPRVVALAEQASVAALDGVLPEGITSVGTAVAIAHLASNKVGTTVLAEATLESVSGRTLTFDFTVTDGAGEVARGTITRVVVDEVTFLSRAR